MRKFSLLLALAIGTALAADPVGAENDAVPTGIDLLKRCNALNQVGEDSAEAAVDTEVSQDYGYCLGYVVGYVSGFAARDVTGEEGRFCPSENARIVDFVEAINQWLVDHPDRLEAMGAVVALQAFQWKFPCPAEVNGGKSQ
jgi:Rap1a immunity proteins